MEKSLSSSLVLCPEIFYSFGLGNLSASRTSRTASREGQEEMHYVFVSRFKENM